MKKMMAIFVVMMLAVFAAPALAANPFMDVPAGHWAYDAVEQLAASGVISGYPEGSFKGSQAATRYEMASLVARALASAPEKDLAARETDILKKLVLEFKNELDALGVKVASLDKRVAALENGVGGWKVRGVFRFDARFGGSDSDKYQFTNGKQNQFTKERFRLYFTKEIDEKSYFYAQYRTGGGKSGGMGEATAAYWSHLYLNSKLPWDIGFCVGRFAVDFEGDNGLYTDIDTVFGGFTIDGFRFSKSFGALDVTAVVGRNAGTFDSLTTVKKDKTVVYDGQGDYMAYILDLYFQPKEKFFIGATGYWGIEDAYNGKAAGNDWDVNTYGVYAGYSITPAIALKGIYYFQNLGGSIQGAKINDSPKAWKAIIDIKQEALKFTSLWLEYSKQDNTFLGNHHRYALGGGSFAYVGFNHPTNNEKTEYFFATAQQQWNSKLKTFLRYVRADFGTNGLDNASELAGGVGYQYTPAIYFELAYAQVDHGSSNKAVFAEALEGKESLIRFRTTVSF